MSISVVNLVGRSNHVKKAHTYIFDAFGKHSIPNNHYIVSTQMDSSNKYTVMKYCLEYSLLSRKRLILINSFPCTKFNNLIDLNSYVAYQSHRKHPSLNYMITEDNEMSHYMHISNKYYLCYDGVYTINNLTDCFKDIQKHFNK